MTSLLLTIIILSGFMFILSVMLMAPKGGLGFGVGGMSTSNEYGSKKSLEWTLKKSAILSIVVFTVCAMLYPYANRKHIVVSNKSNIQVKNLDLWNLKKIDTKVDTKTVDDTKKTTDSVKKIENNTQKTQK